MEDQAEEGKAMIAPGQRAYYLHTSDGEKTGWIPEEELKQRLQFIVEAVQLQCSQAQEYAGEVRVTEQEIAILLYGVPELVLMFPKIK